MEGVSSVYYRIKANNKRPGQTFCLLLVLSVRGNGSYNFPSTHTHTLMKPLALRIACLGTEPETFS